MKVKQLQVSAYRIPTDRPEADGTISWDSTTLVLVEAMSDSDLRGLGFTYASRAAGVLVDEMLADVVVGLPVEPGVAWGAMVRAVRNAGRPGIASTAISAVDIALWDLKARILEQPLFQLLGARPYADRGWRVWLRSLVLRSYVESRCG